MTSFSDICRIHEATYNSAESAELDARLTDANVGGVFDHYAPSIDPGDPLGIVKVPKDSKVIFIPTTPHLCRWCRSHAADDARGNCGACGAPREVVANDTGMLNWRI